MSSHTSGIQFDADGENIRGLSRFGFTALCELDCSVGEVCDSVFRLDGNPIEVKFRVRSKNDGQASCTFVDLSIDAQEKLARYLDAKARVNVGNDDLMNRSYDELAAGITSSAQSSETGEPAKAQTYVKSLAMLVMLLVFVGLALVAVLFMRSRSSLSVANSSLVGNYVPVHARIEGEITEVNCAEGDYVEKGDVLFRLNSPALRLELEDCKSELATAGSKVVALETQLTSCDKKIAVARKKLDIDVLVAEAELEAISMQVQASQKIVQDLAPHVQRAIAQLEFNVANNELLALLAQEAAAKSEVKLKKFARDASQDNILVLGDRLDDEYAKLQAELDIAKAERQHLQRKIGMLADHESQLEILAPRDGFVFAVYRQRGEFVRTADETVAISYPGETWASGMVSVGQASRVRPGQPVLVTVPSLGKKLEGVVSAVGHRAMYAKGNYSAEFRGTTATDVPVKVHIADLPQGIPSGMRLEMTVSTGFGLQWLDDLTGFEIKEVYAKRPESKKVLEQPALATVKPIKGSGLKSDGVQAATTKVGFE